MRHFIYSIGHSNRSIDDFLLMLTAHGVMQLIDVRTVPKSRYNPQFGEIALAQSLAEAGIRYEQEAGLGGFRKPRLDSKNLGWKNMSFRGYADYMATPEFSDALARLEEKARELSTAFMCSEAVPWRCHRSLIADALAVRGWTVYHIMNKTQKSEHALTPFSKVTGEVITYPL